MTINTKAVPTTITTMTDNSRPVQYLHWVDAQKWNHLEHVAPMWFIILDQRNNPGSAEPRSRVEPSSCCIALHRLELGSADLDQLNHHGYTMDDADWTSHSVSNTVTSKSHMQCW